jgi:hypothetical protein
VIAVAAIAGSLVGGAVAGGVAVAVTSGNHGSPASSSNGSSSLTTAAVVRTTLTNTVQVGGSIGYDGSFTVVVPAGTSAQQVAQAQQAVTMDQQNLAADEQAESDASGADNQSIGAAQAALNSAQSTLSADQAQKAKDCAGKGSSTATCSQDAGKVSQDQSQLTQAQQQLATARSSAGRDYDQNQAKVVSDETRLQADEASLASLQATAANSGTTYTALPQVGATIKEDQPVYSLSTEPVPLLYGAIAAYRAFYEGMSDGPDVGELSHDLIALGYGAGLSESNHYSSATAAAVARWQTGLGLPASGEILLGELVFEPGPIRVTSVTPSVGQSVGGGGAGGGGGTVLTATGTTPIVSVDLDVTEEYLVKPGDAVSIVLPDGTTTVGGRIETVGNVASCAGGGGIGTASGGPGGGGSSPCSSVGSGGGSNSTPTVTLTITLDSTPTLATLDQAPVNVNITTERAANVLAAPVNALLALASGGFGVDVVSGSTSHLVGVTTGLYDNTLVQISGSGITVGTRVEVPSS